MAEYGGNEVFVMRFFVAIMVSAMSPKLRIMALIFVIATAHLVDLWELVVYTGIFLAAAFYAELRQSD